MQKEAGSYRTGIPMAGCSIVTIISDAHWPLCLHKSTCTLLLLQAALLQPRSDALCQTAEPAHPHVNSTTCTYHCEALTNDMHIIAYKIVTWISLKAAEVGVKCRDQLIPPLLYGDACDGDKVMRRALEKLWDERDQCGIMHMRKRWCQQEFEWWVLVTSVEDEGK